MSKVKVLRIIGYILIVIGILVFIHMGISSSIALPKFHWGPPSAVASFAVFSFLFTLAFNIFLWAGILALLKANNIDNPDKKSKWLKIIKNYVIFIAIIIVLAILSVIIPVYFPSQCGLRR